MDTEMLYLLTINVCLHLYENTHQIGGYFSEVIAHGYAAVVIKN